MKNNMPSMPVILNDDSCSLRYIARPHSVDQISEPLRYLGGTAVTGLTWCMTSAGIAYSWPSKILESYYDRLAELHGPKDRKGHEDPAALIPADVDPGSLLVSLHRQGIDYLPILIERVREKGIRFFGSFRMNDCHHKSDPHGVLSSKFWQEHQDWRLWEVTDGFTYYNAAMDYSYPEVRERYRAAIHETLQWYDMDGIELDFCRNPYTFQPSEAWEKRQILSDFIAQVKADVDAAAQLRGRTMQLIVRIPFSQKMQRAAGMDVDAWIDNHLCDVLVMSCLANDYQQSIEPWASRCSEKGIAFYPTIEVGPAHNAAHNHGTPQSTEDSIRRQRAAAQNFLGQGAAGIYMFNYPCQLYQSKRSDAELAALKELLNEVASKQALARKPKQYTYWTTLPIQLEARRPARFHQTVEMNIYDDDFADANTQVTISFRQAVRDNPHVEVFEYEKPRDVLPPGWVTYWLNEQAVAESSITRESQPAGRIISGFELPAHEKITLRVPPSAMKFGRNTLGFYIPKFPDKHDPYVMIYELLVTVNG